MTNPIIDNRIVSDKTFAVRLSNFLSRIPFQFVQSQLYNLEEYAYLTHIAERLLQYQKETATNKEEIQYLNGVS